MCSIRLAVMKKLKLGESVETPAGKCLKLLCIDDWDMAKKMPSTAGCAKGEQLNYMLSRQQLGHKNRANECSELESKRDSNFSELKVSRLGPYEIRVFDIFWKVSNL